MAGFRTTLWRLLVLLIVVPLGFLAWWLVRGLLTTPGVVEQAETATLVGLRPEQLPPGWLDILLAVEDPKFFDHNGIDLSTPGAGQTTLTQALVKDQYFDDFEPGPVAKLEQSLYALLLDARLDKDGQLALLLNSASLGPAADGWVVGFPEAAKAYFGKPFAELERREFVVLVAMLIGPATFHPSRGPELLQQRVGRIERLLAGTCHPTDWRDVYYEACEP